MYMAVNRRGCCGVQYPEVCIYVFSTLLCVLVTTPIIKKASVATLVKHGNREVRDT